MTDAEFNKIIELVKKANVHKTYSVEAGFIALTNTQLGRRVIRIDDQYEESYKLALRMTGKILSRTAKEPEVIPPPRKSILKRLISLFIKRTG